MPKKKRDSSQKSKELSPEDKLKKWEKDVDNRLVSHFRKEFMWSPQRTSVIQQAKVAPGKYICASCGHTGAMETFDPGKQKKVKQFEVDHIEAVGGVRQLREDLNVYRSRALPSDPSALQLLCKACHGVKTQLERKHASRRSA